MYEAQVEVRNEPGIHARPAAILVQVASRFASEIHLATEALEVNGKSIMGVMMLAAETGTVVTIRAVGSDEREAVETLARLIEARFDIAE